MEMLAPRQDRACADLLDVLIVGAGLSGIGAACHLQRRCPTRRLAIVEARAAVGGTWDLFRYPGVRSDSGMHTLGYDFRPWTAAKAIADGAAILAYIRDTAREHGLLGRIHLGQRVTQASWSSATAAWTVTTHGADGASATWRARFLYLCSGYYRYDRGHRPSFADEARFAGRVVHTQFWPEDLDVNGREVVVVGSGATAVTLVPALAQSAARVTMLQRSPSYVMTRPSEDRLSQWLVRWLPTGLAYRVTRWKNVLAAVVFFRIVRRYPQAARRFVIRMAERQLGSSCDASVHFAPRYAPWDQRVCVAADGDLFRAIRSGRAAVATGTIERFTEHGLLLADGTQLSADVVVLATGLELSVLGGIALQVDGQPVVPREAMAYKGMMLGDVPNLALAFGYTNASWTLKADLTAGYVCRLLRYMERHGHAIAVPRRDSRVAPQPFLSFTSGYVQRALPDLPKQGSRKPWQVYQNYLLDLFTIRYGRIDDGVLQFAAAGRS